MCMSGEEKVRGGPLWIDRKEWNADTGWVEGLSAYFFLWEMKSLTNWSPRDGDRIVGLLFSIVRGVPQFHNLAVTGEA